ncbi:GATOR complex protein NPRL3 [Gryllus bimaculatus]|nr:GATOR complex protein NPRL3 [Gryllus bimaculatus]
MYPQKAVDPNPLNIILVKSDSKGDRLLFRYPYAADTRPESRQHNRRKNPYALTIAEDLLQSPPPQTSNISKGHLTGFTDEVLSTLFAVKAELCERKFELKVNDVRKRSEIGALSIIFAKLKDINPLKPLAALI